MKKNSTIVLSIIGALAVMAAINPSMQAYAQDDDTVTATQSNSLTATIDQSQTVEDDEYDGDGAAVSGFDNEVSGDAGAVSGFDNEVSDGDEEASQGFCLQANQQNAAAGNEATNTAANEISACIE